MGRKPKYASDDAHAGPWTTCDVCGLIWSQSDMQFQSYFSGASVPSLTGSLRCPKCTDGLDYQNKMIIIPPDPPVFFNLRPEPFRIDDTDWLTTMDGDRMVTMDGDPVIVDVPNAQDEPDVSQLLFTARSVGAGAAIAAGAYLDLFDGNPVIPGSYSVLAAITGSATRTNIASQLTITTQQAVNTLDMTVVAAAVANSNVTHLALFTTVGGSTIILSGPVSASPTVQQTFAVRFLSGAFNITLI